jgi:zinc transporter ZupT
VSSASYNAAYGWAWVALCLALAIHVADEALTDFLSVYNPAVKALRQRWRFLPLPTFSFKVWLGGLIVVLIFLSALSPFAFGGAKWLGALAYFFAGFMIINGLQHIAASIYMRRLMPGTCLAPLLIICGMYLSVHIR